MPQATDNDSKDTRSIVLVVLSIVGAAIGYITSIVVARLLGPDRYEDYAVAISALALMATIAEGGTGKYALRVLPAYTSAGNWPKAAGYYRYAFCLVSFLSVSIAAMVAAWEAWEGDQFGDYAVGIAILFLPAAALSGAGIDFVMANRAAIRGALIARVLIPITSLVLLVVCAGLVDELNSRWAVSCYGLGALVGAFAAGIVFRRVVPSETFATSPVYEQRAWTRECISYLTLALLISWIFRISILVLEMLPVAEFEVAWFAAAMETGTLILLLSKSTDKYFQPYMSLVIEKEEWETAVRLRKQRFIWIGGACSAFLLVIFLFGRSILRWYGEPFVAGYPALCVISVGTCTWTLYSLAPSYLQFIGKSRFVFGTTLLGAIAMAVLTAVLGNEWGATGAACAFSITLCCVAIINRVRAMGHLRTRLKNTKPPAIDA